MPEKYHVRVEKDQFVFSAAHFITFNGDVCERLHGHNYRVAAEVSGPLDENCYVIDFIALRDALKELVEELDHHMLLPTDHPLINVEFDENRVDVRFRERQWRFPRGDCILLPVANTTTELLAKHIGRCLLERLEEKHKILPQALTIEVDECYGQLGIWVWEQSNVIDAATTQ